MVLPYPERFKWKYVAVYAVLLLIVQLMEGTNVYFASLITVYIALFATAFNIAGGLLYSSGAFIFFNGTLVVLVGVTYKCLMGEPGESHLDSPITTMMVYCVGMAGLGLVAFFVRKLRPERGYMTDIAAGEEMYWAAIGCMVLGLGLSVAFGSEYGSSATIGSAVRQINRFPQLALLLATTYEVKKSQGRKGFNWLSIMLLIIMFAGGVSYSSKEGLLTGPVTWMLAAWAAGYNFRTKQVVVGGVFLWFLLYYMIPYTAYVRSFRDETGSRAANNKIAQEYIFKLGEVRKLSQEAVDNDAYLEVPHFYSHDQGLMDRLSMVAYDDALITLTERGNVYGLYPLIHSFINVVPHFIWPGKPAFFTANAFGHEVGVLSEDDFTTGISFSSMADIYHEAEWFGLGIIFPIVLFMYFIIMDSLTGSVKLSPWPLLAIAVNAHTAPEGLMEVIVQQATYGAFGFLVLGLTVKYLFPMVYSVLASGNKSGSRPVIDFRPGRDALVRPIAARVGTEV